MLSLLIIVVSSTLSMLLSSKVLFVVVVAVVPFVPILVITSVEEEVPQFLVVIFLLLSVVEIESKYSPFLSDNNGRTADLSSEDSNVFMISLFSDKKFVPTSWCL